MSIMPNDPQLSRMPAVLRTILYWVTFIAVAVVLWHMAEKPSVRRQPDWLVDLIAAVVVIAVWVFISMMWRRMSRRGSAPKNPENRPLG